MKKPNFFIVGAPKSGTTAMADYLGQHPDIFVCEPKEPCFFSTDFPGQRLVTSDEEYSELFADAEDSHAAVGEGSVWYLYSEEALRNIKRYNRNSKIIVMLRNPIEQVYSMHQELFHRRYETEKSFVSAWNLQETRRQGDRIPKYCREAKFLQYGDIARYSRQIERLTTVFPRDQIKIVLFDDFKRDPRTTYLELLEFLGVEDIGRTEFQPKLESRRHRLHWIGTFLINQPQWMVRIRNRFKAMLGLREIGLREFVARHNTVVEKRKPLPPEFVKELKDYFRADISRLSSILNRDLGHWCD